jgi:hypothetical protein
MAKGRGHRAKSIGQKEKAESREQRAAEKRKGLEAQALGI